MGIETFVLGTEGIKRWEGATVVALPLLHLGQEALNLPPFMYSLERRMQWVHHD